MVPVTRVTGPLAPDTPKWTPGLCPRFTTPPGTRVQKGLHGRVSMCTGTRTDSGHEVRCGAHPPEGRCVRSRTPAV